MELIVFQGACKRRVEVVRDGEAWRVCVDGRQYHVDLAPVDAESRSLLIDGGHSEVSVHLENPGEFLVTSSFGSGLVRVMDLLEYAARQATPQPPDRGTGVVTAYMPGRVAAILIETGQAVSAGEGLVVLEAMKMENEITAEHDGVVGKILVAVGDAVEGGDPLVEVK